MSAVRKAWWRGRKVRASGHSLEWYKISLSNYGEAERVAFMAGFNGEPCPAEGKAA